MVGIRERRYHCEELVDGLSGLRKDGSLCDVSLKVSGRSIPVHRCVLAAASPYFRSMFVGGFNETSATEIDLSSVTDDDDAVQCVINFIYTGDIDLSIDNISVLFQLSSFFLLENLANMCMQFILKSQNLENCLKYYFVSVGHGFPELESLVLARFHDHLIFQEDTLNVSPTQMHTLYSENVMKWCSAPEIANFLAKWVDRGLTEQHFVEATHILDTIDSGTKQNDVDEAEMQNIRERLGNSVSRLNIEFGDTFIHQLDVIMTEMSGACEDKLAPRSTLLPGLSGDSNEYVAHETENVVITFSPTLWLAECVEKLIADKDKENSVPDRLDRTVQWRVKPSFDICLYNPMSLRWYYLHSFSADDLNVPMYDGDTAETVLYTAWHHLQDAKFYCRQQKLVIITNYCITSLDIGNLTWTHALFDGIFAGLDNDDDMFGDYALTVGKQNTEYLVAKVSVYGPALPENVSGVHFLCFEVHSDEEEIIGQLLFKTPTVSANVALTSTLRAEYISSSDELVVVLTGVKDSHKDLVAFVADMTMSPPAVTMLPRTETMSEDTQIIRGQDRVYLVEGFPRVCPIFEYKLKSGVFEAAGAPEIADEFGDYDYHVKQLRTSSSHFPCRTRLCFSDSESVWCIDGSKQGISSLSQVSLNDENTPVEKDHRPPPFRYVTAAFSGKVMKDILKNLKPVSRYPLR